MDELRASITDRPLLIRATQISRPDNGSWHQLERAAGQVWARFHGTQEYHVVVDLSGPRYRCTCPTATQPCKHGLALHLIAVGQPSSLVDAPAPAWVGKALAGADGPSPKTRSARGPSTARTERRYEEIDAGVRELDLWLTDQVRTGIATLPTRVMEVEALSRRLWDAKAKGLARAVTALVESPPSPGWQGRTLERMGRLHLLLEAWRRRDALDDDLVADLATLLGVSQRRSDALDQPAVNDVWDVLGSKTDYSDEQHLVTMRTWLRGRHTDRYAMILEQAYAHDRPPELSTSFDKTLQVGKAYEAELCFHRSAWPVRAEVRARGQRFEGVAPAALRTLTAAHARFVDALARQPWLWGIPIYVGGLCVESGDEGFTATDSEGCEVALDIDEELAWAILANFGGGPCALFGEWDGQRLHVIWPQREKRS